MTKKTLPMTVAAKHAGRAMTTSAIMRLPSPSVSEYALAWFKPRVRAHRIVRILLFIAATMQRFALNGMGYYPTTVRACPKLKFVASLCRTLCRLWLAIKTQKKNRQAQSHRSIIRRSGQAPKQRKYKSHEFGRCTK